MIRYAIPSMIVAGLAITVGSSVGPVSAAVYKWVDAEGKVHYGDQPAPGAADTRRFKTRGAAGGSGTTPRGPSAPQNTPDAPAGQAGSAKMAAREAEIRAEECERAQTRLASYRQADRLIQTHADGSQEEMSPEARVAAIARVSNHVDALCAKP